MRRIDGFLNSIYKDLEGNDQEKQELKEEMRVHLIEKVNEFKEQGKTEKEAINLAIEDFGDKKTISNGLKEFFDIPKISFGQYFYLLFMFILYFGYVFLVNQQLNMSEVWLSKDIITTEDVESIHHLGKWTETFEVIFIMLFAIMSIFYLVSYIKNHGKTTIVLQFIAINLSIFAVITTLSFILAQFTQVPIGNLLQPLIFPSIAFGALIIYMSWGLLKIRFLKK